MPSRYVLRDFKENCYYHIANYGVDKRTIFTDEEDFRTFLYYLKVYLLPKDVIQNMPNLPKRMLSKSRYQEVELIAYTLMPNHFHLLLVEKEMGGISKFMKQLSNAYTKYFNERQKRSGSLFEGPFKAVEVKEEDLTQVVRYIHLNSFLAGLVDDPEKYRWSDFPTYTNSKEVNISNAKVVLEKFNTSADYKHFVHNYMDYAEKVKTLDHILIDN